LSRPGLPWLRQFLGGGAASGAAPPPHQPNTRPEPTTTRAPRATSPAPTATRAQGGAPPLVRTAYRSRYMESLTTSSTMRGVTRVRPQKVTWSRA
jgi:hypothetical protein